MGFDQYAIINHWKTENLIGMEGRRGNKTRFKTLSTRGVSEEERSEAAEHYGTF